jgi:peptidoglycan/LPS O-acetylase OafA/YrhL
VVLALFARDAGDERAARQFLASVAARFPAGAPLHRMINAPIRGWPRDLPSMIAEPVKPAGQ